MFFPVTPTKSDGEDKLDGPLIKTEEIIILTIIFSLWIGIIFLFFKQWGKIRLLEPYQSPFEAAEEDPTLLVSVPGTTSPLARLNSTKLLQARTSSSVPPNYSNLITKNKWKKVNTLVHVMQPSVTTAAVTTESKNSVVKKILDTEKRNEKKEEEEGNEKKTSSNTNSESCHTTTVSINPVSSVTFNKFSNTGCEEVKRGSEKGREERRRAWKELCSAEKKEVRLNMNPGLITSSLSCTQLVPLNVEECSYNFHRNSTHSYKDKGVKDRDQVTSSVKTVNTIEKDTLEVESNRLLGINIDKISSVEINNQTEQKLDPKINHCQVDMELKPVERNIFHIHYTVSSINNTENGKEEKEKTTRGIDHESDKQSSGQGETSAMVEMNGRQVMGTMNSDQEAVTNV